MKTLQNFFQSLNIRNKVLIFGILMSSIPLLLISTYYFSFVKADLENRILEKQNLMIESLSHEIEFDFSQIFQRIHVFAAMNQSNMDINALYEMLTKSPSVEEIIVSDDKGFVEKRVSRYELNLPGVNEEWFTDQMWFSLQTEEKIYGEVEFNQYGQPIMKLAVPFYTNDSQKAIGVVVQLQTMIGEISSLRQDDSAYIYIVDGTERVIAHQDYSRLWQKQSTLPDKKVIGVKTKLENLNWELVMEQPETTAFAPIYKMLQNGLAAALFVILTVSLISVWAGLYFTKPIVQLDQEMNRLKRGKRSTPISINRKDELGKLASTFNHMSRDLLEKSQQLEQEKERLDVVVNGIGSGLALVTKEYQITWMNPILLSWLKEEQLSLPCYTVIGGENSPCVDCPITCADLEKNTEQLKKFTNDCGEDRIFRHRVFELNHAIEGQGEFLIVLEDITEQKQMEEKIIQTDKLSALGLMASNFAHEVNNPLTTINVYAEDLIDRIESTDDDLDDLEMKYYLEKIKENTQRCNKITSNLLNFSRKSDWSLEILDINKIIEDSINLVEYQIKRNRIQLVLDLEAVMPTVLGDGLKLMQVLVNLINNAVDAMEPEGKLTIIATADPNGSVLLKVKDNGHGISTEVMAKLFDPFFTTKPVGKGTGLGLSVCYGIIQQFGGGIRFESQQGLGTTAEIHLPAQSRLKEGNSYVENQTISR